MKKRKDGYYTASKMVNGKRMWFYGKTKAEAFMKREEYTGKVNNPLFEDMAEDWWEHHSSSLAYNTLRGYRPSYERAVHEFGDMFITEIIPSNIAEYIMRMADRGYSDKTVRTQLSVLNMIFLHAINYRGIDMTNPARDVRIPRGLGKKKVTLPSAEDIQKVKESVTQPFGLFAYMLMYTGLRRGELLALTYEDIKDGFISVNKTIYYVGNTPHIKTPKTSRGTRRVPVLDRLSPFIKGKRGYIFGYRGKPLPYHVFLKNWSNYCKNTGIKCTPHQLRHCFATMLYEADVTPKDAQYLLGHAQISTTMDIYTDIRQSREDSIKSKIKSIDVV